MSETTANRQEQFNKIIQFIKDTFNEPEAFIPLHAPTFEGNEKKYLLDTLDSTYVSTVGKFVDQFEEEMKKITGARFAIAAVNGTAALHLALLVTGVLPGDLVITQPLTFAATANAIAHAGATPAFVDVDEDTLGLSPAKLQQWLKDNAEYKNGVTVYKKTGQKISACVPMHTFGFPLRIQEVVAICEQYNIIVVEDAAESLGSFVGQQHTGTFGLAGTFSFNGNKTITSGGGGCVITNDPSIGTLAKHISTTAKQKHAYKFFHDQVGYNYRMPNLNAALACAQLEQLPVFLKNKRELAFIYKHFFDTIQIPFVTERENTTANYWLNTILLKDNAEKDFFLELSNANNVMSRPAWALMNTLPMYITAPCGNIENAKMLEQRIVNIPSSVRTK